MSDLTRIALALLVMALREQKEEEEPLADPALIEIPPLSPEIRTVDRWGPS